MAYRLAYLRSPIRGLRPMVSEVHLMTAKRGPKGAGSAFALPDGSWRAQLDLGMVNGRRVRRTRTCRPPDAQRKARRALVALRKEADQGLLPETATVEQWIERWLTSITKARQATKDGYRSKIDRYIVPAIGHHPLQKLRPEHIRVMQESMREQGLAPATIRQTHSILRAALRVAHDEKRISHNPAAVKSLEVTVAKNPHKILTPAQAVQVVNAATSNRDRARLMAALWLGLRQSEALGLDWAHVHQDADRPWLDVVQAARREKDAGMIIYPPKSKESVRAVPMAPAVASAFAAWRKESGGVGWVFPSPTGGIGDPSRDARDWAYALKAARVPHRPLHGARGTAATIMLMDTPLHVAARFLGHSNPTVTLAHYAHSLDEQLADAADALGRRMLTADGQPSGPRADEPDVPAQSG